MNQYQSDLYYNLMTLVNKLEAFYFVDMSLDNTFYKVFNYRLASYTEFNENKDALECRGIMFEVSEEGYNATPIRLASISFPKFHNVGELPLTMDLDLSTVVEIANKMDGSIITTFIHNNTLQVKSKCSLISDQAVNSSNYLNLEKNKQFHAELIKAEQLDCTVIMEFCAMNNRIVLTYPEPHLKVLGVRSRIDGSFIHFDEIDCEHFPEILNRWTQIIKVDDPKAYLETVSEQTGVEGVVFRMPSGQLVKLKTSWYVNLHKNKDNVNSPKKLFEAVVYETSDDLKSLFFDDSVVIDIIVNMEQHVSKIFNHIADSTERFYERNKNLDRKEYAILGQKELPRNLFHLAMTKYLGKEVDYKDHMVKNFDNYKPDESSE